MAAGQLLNYLFGIGRYDLRPLLRVDASVAELPVAGLFGRDLGRPLYLCRDRETTTFGLYYLHVASGTPVELGSAGVTSVPRHGGNGPDDTELVCHFRAVVPIDRGVDRSAYVEAVRELQEWVTVYMAVDSGDLNRNQKMAMAEEYFRSALLPIRGGFPVSTIGLPGYLRDSRLAGWQDLDSGHFLGLSLAMGRGHTLTTRESLYAETGWSRPPLPDIGPRGHGSWLRAEAVLSEERPAEFDAIDFESISVPITDIPVTNFERFSQQIFDSLVVPNDVLRGRAEDAVVGSTGVDDPLINAEDLEQPLRSPESITPTPRRPSAPANPPVGIDMYGVPDDLIHRPEFTAALQAMVNLAAGLCPNQTFSLDVASQTGRILSYKPELTTDDRPNSDYGRWLQPLDQENP